MGSSQKARTDPKGEKSWKRVWKILKRCILWYGSTERKGTFDIGQQHRWEVSFQRHQFSSDSFFSKVGWGSGAEFSWFLGWKVLYHSLYSTCGQASAGGRVLVMVVVLWDLLLCCVLLDGLKLPTASRSHPSVHILAFFWVTAQDDEVLCTGWWSNWVLGF